MGQCVLKDCGFEYQKVKADKGLSFADFFKEKMKAKKESENVLTEEKPDFDSSLKMKRKKTSGEQQETTKINPFLNSKYLEKKPRSNFVHDDMIIDINHSKNPDHSENLDISKSRKGSPVRKSKGKISELGSQAVYNKNRPKVRRMYLPHKLTSQNFTPLLDSLRDSLDKSPFQSKISLNDKYEKSSLFRAAQTNFQQTTQNMDPSDEENDIYDNIFSDADSYISASKQSGFLNPLRDNIINVKSPVRDHGQ